MSARAEIWLAIIAFATAAMAVVQVGVIVAAARMARRLDRLADQVEHEMKPVIAHLDAIGRDASRAAAVAATQVERADRLFTEVADKIERTASSIQSTLLAPAREGRAIAQAIRAAFSAFREMREQAHGRQHADDEDALFI